VIMFQLSIHCSGWPRPSAHRVRRVVIHIVERIIDGLLRSNAVSDNVIGKNYSSTSAGILRTVMINLSSRLSTSHHLSL
jgi:hypothetical protein